MLHSCTMPLIIIERVNRASPCGGNAVRPKVSAPILLQCFISTRYSISFYLTFFPSLSTTKRCGSLIAAEIMAAELKWALHWELWCSMGLFFRGGGRGQGGRVHIPWRKILILPGFFYSAAWFEPRTQYCKTFVCVEYYSLPATTDQISHETSFSFPKWLTLAKGWILRWNC